MEVESTILRDAIPSGYTGPVMSMFGHLKGLRKANEIKDLNVWAAVGSRVYNEMQESENHKDMQELLLLLLLGENKVDESYDPKSASEVDEMGDSENTDIHHHQK